MGETYLTASQVKHDGKRYAIGEKIELDDETAAKLLARGVIGEVPQAPLVPAKKKGK